MKRQETFLDEVLDEEKFALIILDACRYDSLNNLLDRDVRKIDSGVPNTHTWIKENWMGTYDITYISALPWVANQEVEHPNAGKYDASKHFKKVVESWRISWDDELDTILPSALASDANKNIDDKMIIHFNQPHFPHIGENKLTNDDVRKIPNVGASDISDEYVWKSYHDNLRRVWDEGVMNLDALEENDRVNIITADHGEALGEDGEYGHNSYHDKVTTVPWIDW